MRYTVTPYIFQPYPSVRYGENGVTIIVRNDEEAAEAVAAGYVDHPDKVGTHAAHIALSPEAIAAAIAADPPSTNPPPLAEPETVEASTAEDTEAVVLARPRGRPRVATS
jgi:hypothetical protein